jgi:membrane protease subunit HflK
MIVGVQFQDVHPPLAVVDAYRDVSRAESDRRRRHNEGVTYRATALAEARGEAAQIRNRAEADRASRVARAGGESASFAEQLSPRAVAPGLTDHRLYWETIASALAGKPKVVLDPDATRARHLILPNLPLEAAAGALAPSTRPPPAP